MKVSTDRVIRVIVIYCAFISLKYEVRAQNDGTQKYREVLIDLLYNNFEEAENKLKTLAPGKEREVLSWHLKFILGGTNDSIQASISESETSFVLVLRHVQNSNIEQYAKNKKDSIVIKNLHTAYGVAKESQDELLVRYVLYNMVSYLYAIDEKKSLIEPYLKELELVSMNEQDLAFFKYYRGILDSQYSNRDNSRELRSALALIEKTENYLLKAKILQMIGVFESYFNKDQKEALSCWRKAADNFELVPGVLRNQNLFGIYNNIAVANVNLENNRDAFEYYYKAQAIKPNDKPLQVAFFYQGLAELHKVAKNIDSSFYYLAEEKRLLKTYYDSNSNEQLRNLLVKYQTAEKEKQILEEQQKSRTTRNWLVAAGLALIFGSGIAILLQKNTTKKRLLAEQEALLKQERVDNLLKAQELVSIDAMIAGQEKERQRVANELHDDLGSLMATIKLHFDNANSSKKDPALQHAQRLLEEAYQKVRGMAHSKNSGVMSDQGLLPAIKKMAQVISETNALEVTVEDFGMGERLENSLELNLFRMVQELVANAIKHAEATKVGIQLTQHEDNLNIIIEDNGQGFDRSKVIADQTGMGLTTIEKRVEHLEGQFTVDSVLGRGTSILIDIPV